LIKVTGDLTGNLRQFPYTWQDSVHQVELFRDEFFVYRTPPLSKKEDIDAANKFLADRLEEANSTQKRELSSLLQEADSRCRSLLEYIPKEKRTAEDNKKHEEIIQLMQDMWHWECCPSSELNSLADYLDGLARRVASGDSSANSPSHNS
jgi:hypothetical protein